MSVLFFGKAGEKAALALFLCEPAHHPFSVFKP
jgi:hypothetical protein